MHRRRIVDLQHQLCRQRRSFGNHEAHAAILAVAVNPSVGDGHHAVAVVVLLRLCPYGVVRSKVAAVDVDHRLREGLAVFLVLHFVRFAYGNGFVDLRDWDGDAASIVDLGLDIAIIIGVGRGALALRLRSRLAADGARQFGDILAVVVILEDFPPHLGHRGVVEVGEVVENFCIENGVTQGFIKNVVYPNDDYSYTKITDYTTQETQYRKDLPQPVIIEIPATNGGKALILETYTNGNLVRTDEFCVGQRALEIWNLIPQTQYTYKLYLVADDDTKTEVSQGSFKTEGQLRMMKIDGTNNCRDIGGWKLPNGKFVKLEQGFIFSIGSEIKIFNINSDCSDLLFIDHNKILVGKDFNNSIAITISGDLSNGETHEGECFNNPCLINKEDGNFQIDMI